MSLAEALATLEKRQLPDDLHAELGSVAVAESTLRHYCTGYVREHAEPLISTDSSEPSSAFHNVTTALLTRG